MRDYTPKSPGGDFFELTYTPIACVTYTAMADMFYGALPRIFEKAKMLRNTMTVTEHILWNQLSKKQLGGYKFRKQHPINNYIVDFYCHEAKLVVEIDGDVHTQPEQAEYDKGRTHNLQMFGITVIRFTNHQIETQLEQVLTSIASHLIS
jgi:very-short-patch-repair endonuclease